MRLFLLEKNELHYYFWGFVLTAFEVNGLFILLLFGWVEEFEGPSAREQLSGVHWSGQVTFWGDELAQYLSCGGFSDEYGHALLGVWS